MKTIRKIMITAISALLLGGSIASASELRLTVANGIAPSITTGWFVDKFIVPRLEKYSDGKIDAQGYVSGSLCSEATCMEQAQMQQIDIGSISAGNIGAFGSTFDILILPYLFKDEASAEKLLGGRLGEELKKRAIEEMGVRVMAFIPAFGFRNVVNSVREVRIPEDLRGIKIRVTKSPVAISLFRSWGATAVPFPWAQIYEGLQTGVVEGLYAPDPYVAARALHEVAPYITHTGGSLNTHIFFMQEERYQALPDWAKEVIDRVGREIQEAAFAEDRRLAEAQSGTMDGKVNIYVPKEEELKKWSEGSVPAWIAVKDKYDHSLARSVLEEQGMTGLIKALEKEGAL